LTGDGEVAAPHRRKAVGDRIVGDAAVTEGYRQASTPPCTFLAVFAVFCSEFTAMPQQAACS
jgi:hypothetical protein